MSHKYSETFKKADGEMILDETTVDTLMSFIQSQINDPFSNEMNYFKKIKKKYEDDRDTLEEYCANIIGMIEDKYPSLKIDMGMGNINIVDFTDTLYKFLIKNINTITYFFIKEFIYNNKNRKALLSKYSDMKIPSYPKDQYGKKENYILMIKISDIIKEIINLDIDMDEFIKYVNKSGNSVYVDLFEKYYNDGIIVDDGIYKDIMDLFEDSDCYCPITSKISVKVYDAIVKPTLDESDGDALKFKFISESDESLDDYNEDSDNSDDTEVEEE